MDVATEAETVAKPSDVTTEGEAQREKVTGTASHLWPYASITAVVRVINGAHRGPPSLPVVFNTSEGGKCFCVDHYHFHSPRRSSAKRYFMVGRKCCLKVIVLQTLLLLHLLSIYSKKC